MLKLSLMQCLEGCEEIMINTGQMAPWSRPHFNFLPPEILCYIFSSYLPYSTVLLNLTVTQFDKKYIPLMEFKHPQPRCQGPEAEFNPQSVYIFTFWTLLSHLTLVIVFNEIYREKGGGTEACKMNTQVTSKKCVISISKKTRETSNYFYAYFKKQDWTIESFLYRWWYISMHIQSSLQEHMLPKCNKCIILEIMWLSVFTFPWMNHIIILKNHTDLYNYFSYCVFYAHSFRFSTHSLFFLAVWHFQVFIFRFSLCICLGF